MIKLVEESLTIVRRLNDPDGYEGSNAEVLKQMDLNDLEADLEQLHQHTGDLSLLIKEMSVKL